MLRRVRIKGFKSLSEVDIGLGRLVVLLGPNAVGKSNFLEALLLLSRLVTQRTLGDAFEALRGHPHEAFTLPEAGLEGLLGQDSANLSLLADVQPWPSGNGNRSDRLRYRVEIQSRPATGSLAVVDEYFSRLNKDFAPKGQPRIELHEPMATEESGPGRLAVRQQRGRPRYEPLGLDHTLASDLQFSGEHRYPEFDRLRSELGSWVLYYLDPMVSMRRPQAPREITDIGVRGELLAPFLYRLKEDERLKPHFAAIRRALHSAIPTIEDIDVDLDRKRGVLDIQVRQNGTVYSSRVISEGTLRILALCGVAANPWPASLVAFEEPENGVHPRRIDVIAELLLTLATSGRTQVIVTTHSPALVAAMARRKRELPEGGIELLRCTQEGRRTRISSFDPSCLGSLFEDEETRAALMASEDAAVITGLLESGWLDG